MFWVLALCQSKKDRQTDNELYEPKVDVGMLNIVKSYNSWRFKR